MSRTHPNGPAHTPSPAPLSPPSSYLRPGVSFSHSLPTTQDLDLNRWIRVLDSESKGYISAKDVADAAFACGIEPTIVDMKLVTDLKGNLAKAVASMELFKDHGIPFDSAVSLINYFRTEGYQMRPDKFEYWSARPYFYSRWFSYQIPFLANVLQPVHIPNYTPYEQSIYNIIYKLVGSVNSCLGMCTLGVAALKGLGLTTTIKWSEIVVSWFILGGLGFAALTAREGVACAKENLAISHRCFQSMSTIRYATNTTHHAKHTLTTNSTIRYATFMLTNGKTISGSEALHYFSRSCTNQQIEANE